MPCNIGYCVYKFFAFCFAFCMFFNFNLIYGRYINMFVIVSNIIVITFILYFKSLCKCGMRFSIVALVEMSGHQKLRSKPTEIRNF